MLESDGPTRSQRENRALLTNTRRLQSTEPSMYTRCYGPLPRA